MEIEKNYPHIPSEPPPPYDPKWLESYRGRVAPFYPDEGSVPAARTATLLLSNDVSYVLHPSLPEADGATPEVPSPASDAGSTPSPRYPGETIPSRTLFTHSWGCSRSSRSPSDSPPCRSSGRSIEVCRQTFSSEDLYTYDAMERGVRVRLMDPSRVDTLMLGDCQQFPAQFQGKKRPPAARITGMGFTAFILYTGFFTCIGVILWLVNRSEQDRIKYFPAVVFLFVAYVLIQVESYVSATNQYLYDLVSVDQAHSYVDAMRQTVPSLCFYMGSINYSMNVAFSECLDVSGDLNLDNSSGITRIHFDKSFGFVDRSSRQRYINVKKEFRKVHTSSMKSETRFSLRNMRYFMLVYKDSSQIPWALGRGVYLLSSLLCLSWIYRLWFHHATSKKRFTFLKLLRIKHHKKPKRRDNKRTWYDIIPV